MGADGTVGAPSTTAWATRRSTSAAAAPAFGVANGSTLTVMQILQAWDQVADPNNWALRHMAKDVFGNINGG